MKRSCFFICSLFAFISPICLFAQTPPVVISEVFYDSPLEEDMLSSPDDHHNGEYIELYNAASMAADISGWKIADCNSSFSFPEKTIMGARSTLLVAFRSPKTNFKIHHLFPELQNADTGKIFYQSKFWLSNEGERISLYNNRSQLVDRMSYRSRATDEKKADFWHILANNTRNQEREELRSIVRKDIHTSHLGVTPLLGDYGQDKASPLSQDNELPVVDLLYLPIDKEIQVNRSLEVGTIEGQPSVSPSGAAMYQIPISTPPGTNGFQPNVSIVYNSQSSIGALGQGWDISGISAIGRIPKSVYFDGYTDKIRYDNTDALSLDGQRLVLLQGDNLKPGAVYGLEQEDYTRIYVKANGADVYFELITKDGLKSEFGKTEDSKLISSREESWSDTSETILAWKLNKTENTFQNTINYSYVENGLYLSKISYLNGLNTVEFDYKDICNDFVRVVNIFGGLIKHTKLLSSLTTKHDGNKVKEYTFSYITTDIECRLDEIVETTPTGKKLNSTKINWLETGSKLQLISTDTKMQDTGLHDVGNSRLIAGDMDGDGRPDLIEVWTGAYSEEHHLEFCYFRVILKDRVLPAVTIDTYKQFYPHFEPQLLVSDINNDGINEIIAVNLEHVQVYAINAARNKMELKSTCYYSAYNYLDNEAYAYTALLSKEHKDSKYPSLYIISYIKREKPSSYTVSSPFTAHVFHNQNGVLSSSSSFLVGQGSVDGYFSAPFFADIHGWGNYTLCSLIDSSVQTETNRTSNEIKINDCLTLTETKQWALDLFEVQTGIFQSGKKVIPQYAKLQTINYNGDGITDLLVQNNTNKKPNYGWSVLSWGERRNNQKIELKNVVRAENRKKENRYEVFVLDYNGDGLDDIIIADETYLKSSKKLKTEYYCHKNIGGDFIHERTFEIYEGMSNLNHVVADYNHDGALDLIIPHKGNNTYYVITQPYPTKEKLVSGISNGLGQVVEFSYSLYANSAFTQAGTDIRPLNTPMYVVSQMAVPEDYKFRQRVTYSYGNARYHKEKGSLGFEKTTETNHTTGIQVITHYDINGDFHYPYIRKRETKTLSGTVVSTSEFCNEAIPVDKVNKRFMSVNTRQVETDVLRNITKTTSCQYDSAGRLLERKEETGDRTRIDTYSDFVRCNNSLVAYLPKTLRTILKKAGQDDFKAATKFDYTDKGLLKTEVEYADKQFPVTTTYEYNPEGTLKKKIVGAPDISTVTTEYSYDDYSRAVIGERNSLGQYVHTRYDFSTGNIIEKEADGLKTEYQYDEFGRLSVKKHPTGESISYSYQWDDTYNALYAVTQTSDKTGVKTTAYYDAYDQEIVTETTGWNGQTVKLHKEYNAKGQLVKQTEPAGDGEPALIHTYSYDELGRVKTDELLDGSSILTTAYSYNGRTTTVSLPDGQSRVSIIDGCGNVVRRQDNGGTIVYQYNAQGQIVTATVGEDKTVVEYDEYGNQTKLIDPNAGIIKYGYNSLGDIVYQVTARNDSTSYTYDEGNRMKTKTVFDRDNGLAITTSWEYVASGNGIGQIKKEERTQGQNIHTREYEYDSRHLLRKVTDTYREKADDAPRIYTRTFDYDDLWRVEYETTPSGLRLKNTYDHYGYLTQISVGDEPVWTATEINGQDVVTDYLLGNGLGTVQIYSASGLLEEKRTGSNPYFQGGSQIQKLAYRYDPQTYNLIQRIDGKNDRSEEFEYDELSRLTLAKLNGEISYEMQYYDSGNIKEKTDVGTYLYNLPQPHAMSGISGSTGNGITDDVQTITYTAFNKIETVSQADDSYRIVYGLDDQRIKTIYSYDDTEKLTRYYFGSFEVETDSTGHETQTDYISSPVGLVALARKQDGERNLFYVHTDLLGSIQAVTDNNGQLVAEYAYTPWGGRIHLQGDGHFTDRGYTGHEHLEPLGLINMNGRVYDPTLARFLSPDPYVQAPDFTQSFNRYSYCWNNPFKYTDPSGEFFYLIPSVSYSSGGGVNLSISAGIGFYGAASVGITVGYGTTNGNWSLTANAAYMGAYIYGGYDSNAGWIAGLGWGFGGLISQQNVSIGSNITSVGVNWSQRGGVSYNVFGMVISDGGAYFDPSISGSYIMDTGRPIYVYADADIKTTSGSKAVDYNTESLREFMENNNLTSDGLRDSFAGLPPKATDLYKNKYGQVFRRNGSEVAATVRPSGLKRYIFWGSQKYNLYVFKVAFISKDRLYMTIGHELVHIDLFYAGFTDNQYKHEATAWTWEAMQREAWGVSSINQTEIDKYGTPYDHYQYTRIIKHRAK